MAYVELSFVKNVLRDDLLDYPADLTPYFSFAEMEINSKLAERFYVPFDDTGVYASVPTLIQWIAAYLVGYRIFDRNTATQNNEDSAGNRWWAMAQVWLEGLRTGAYDLILADGTLVTPTSSTTGPRAYPTGVRDKAASSDNLPLFKRSQAGEW